MYFLDNLDSSNQEYGDHINIRNIDLIVNNIDQKVIKID